MHVKGNLQHTYVSSDAQNAPVGRFHQRIGGSVVECSPATRAARVRFPADASFTQLHIRKGLLKMHKHFTRSLTSCGVYCILFGGDYWVVSKTRVRQPGVEPGSTAWKATMLTVTPLTLHSSCTRHVHS